MRYCTFKLLTTGRKQQFCSIIQLIGSRSTSHSGRIPGCLNDHIPIPEVPKKSSYVKIELISNVIIPVDFSNLVELQFSLPVGFDNAILNGFSSNCDYIGSYCIDDWISVWDIYSE